MDNNPYAPPNAPVAEIEPPQARVRPPEVARAVQLLWMAVVIGILAVFFRRTLFPTLPSKPELLIVFWVTILVVGGAVIGLLVWLFTSIARGRNWARIAFLVLILLRLAATPLVWQRQVALAKASPVAAFLTFVVLVMYAYALYLLFSKAAGPWFRPSAEVTPARRSA